MQASVEIGGEPRISLVLRDDTLIVELEAANRALERNPAYPRLPMPATMRDLVGRYEYGVKAKMRIQNSSISTLYGSAGSEARKPPAVQLRQMDGPRGAA